MVLECMWPSVPLLMLPEYHCNGTDHLWKHTQCCLQNNETCRKKMTIQLVLSLYPPPNPILTCQLYSMISTHHLTFHGFLCNHHKMAAWDIFNINQKTTTHNPKWSSIRKHKSSSYKLLISLALGFHCFKSRTTRSFWKQNKIKPV